MHSGERRGCGGCGVMQRGIHAEGEKLRLTLTIFIEEAICTIYTCKEITANLLRSRDNHTATTHCKLHGQKNKLAVTQWSNADPRCSIGRPFSYPACMHRCPSILCPAHPGRSLSVVQSGYMCVYRGQAQCQGVM